MFLESQLLVLCQESVLPRIFESREEAMYIIRLSQCKIQRSFQVVHSRDNLYHIKCTHSCCPFYIKVSNSNTGEHLSSGLWSHSCSINDHIIAKYKSPASDCNFLARYIQGHVNNGVTSQNQLQKILITELGRNVRASTVGRALAIATSKFLFNEDKGYNLIQSYCDRHNNNGGYGHLDTVEVNQDEDAVSNEDFPSKRFIRNFISLKAQKRVAEYAKFACLDACHLSGKFKGMLICATTQDSNGTIFILSQASVPREDEGGW